MPAPQASMMKQLCRLQYSTNGLKMPDQWTAPSGDPAAAHYAKDYVQKPGSPDTTVPPLYMAASMTKDHTDTQKKITSVIGTYLDGIVTAICSAWSTWQSAATLVGVTIAGPVAAAGQVVGPPLMPLIMAEGPKSTPMELKYTTTIANVINTSWLTYTAGIKVPGLPWYPAFAAFPGPVTPPTPNIPCPVITISTAAAAVAGAAMKGQMIGMHGDPMAQWHKEIFDAVTDAFEKCHKIWEASTMVTNVLGTGPVPSFAPPYVPVGPVVGGVGTMTPGGFT